LQAAIANGYRQHLREAFQILTYVKDGLLAGTGLGRFATVTEPRPQGSGH